MHPKISVILPVYNGADYLEDAIKSIITQTFQDFELILINDGSTDDSMSIIKKYKAKDKRIRVINRKNKGLVYSLNEGIFQAKGEFIARMDADDICLPTRLEDQLNYMQAHNLDLCGSWIQPFTENRILPFRKYPEKHEDITISMIFFNCFAHPSMIIRNKVFSKLKYNDEAAEDYQLWCNAIIEGFHVGNIPKVLLKYRVHSKQITKNKAVELDDSANRNAKDFASKLGNVEQTIYQNVERLVFKGDRKLFPTISEQLEHLIISYRADPTTHANVLLWLYNKSLPKTPLLYYQYRKLTKKNNTKSKDEITLFLKSFLYLSPDSKSYDILQNIYNNKISK